MSSDSKAAVVVIDGDVKAAEKSAALLARHRYRVRIAGSVSDGLERVCETRAELALIDRQTAGDAFPAVLEEFRSRFPSTYLMVAVPGRRKPGAELAGNSQVEWLSTPFGSGELVRRLDSLLHIRELELNNKRLQLEQELLLIKLETCSQDSRQLIREKTESLRRAHSEIAQTEKLAALGYLTAGMAHDIRNPLNSISLFSQLLRQGINDPDQAEYLAKIIREIERIDGIIRKMLEMSRGSRRATCDVRIDQVIDDALELFAPRLEIAGVRLERCYEAVPPALKADPEALLQLFTSLFLNALDEMPEGGRLVVGISQEGGMVVVRVEDSGKGILEHALPKMFEPFFTTKSRGTGLGLPVVKRIARIHGGSVSVERSGPEGTVLRLELPLPRGG